ncbi:VOC family protein [Kineobactrum salinum]|uniref:Dioxygenase n=1 Tax=Kineobactrum salinum TaxID=2708301 RepID=A0A6C0U8P5_9GAMM|nr:VOC family protein [Kineobactrum salinum]QIB66915.1 dioxygenase [Kineobactrum salinum]
MTVSSTYAYTLEVPDLAAGEKFYGDAGFQTRREDGRLYCRCPGQDRDCVVLIGGAPRKRLHHLTLRADPAGLDTAAAKAETLGGRQTSAPQGFDDDGLWLTDPHGMLVHLADVPPDPPLIPAKSPFAINQPGRTVRTGRSAMLAREQTELARPMRLGHVLVFSPDVDRSVQFYTQALGLGLSDRARDVIAFCCARRNSDHHILAFAKSNGVGFHHGSFQVTDPDDVGRAGAALLEKSGRGDWGFGRHTIGSNYFHYIQDPWGSWFEYYTDMDYIDDYALWTPTNYGMEDSLANWGPPVPEDFVHNYEVDEQPFNAGGATQ